MKMVEISLWNKIKTIFSLIFSSPLFLVLLFGFLLMVVDIFVISKKQKITKISYLIVSLVIIGLLLKNYFSSLFSIFDTIFKNIVTIIYFPSVLEYIIMLIVSLVILFISLFSKKTNKKVRVINSFVFSTNIFLFFLILDQISKNKIDLSNKVSIYSNENLMVLFELSILIFIIWIVGLILYKIIYTIIHKDDKPLNFYDAPELPSTIEELRQKELIPEPKIEYIVVEKDKAKEDKDDLSDMFTLEEYKQMRQLLQEIKDKQNKED